MASVGLRGDGLGTFDPATGLTVEERREVLAAIEEARGGAVDDLAVERVKELLRQMDSWMEQAARRTLADASAAAPDPAGIVLEASHVPE